MFLSCCTSFRNSCNYLSYSHYNNILVTCQVIFLLTCNFFWGIINT
nr:MAG TPA: hypothetical protein [Caudoviricetes sp.]